MSASEILIQGKCYTAAELRKLPAAERDAILLAAAELAASDYDSGSELTAFETYGKNDLHGESSNTTTRRDLAN